MDDESFSGGCSGGRRRSMWRYTYVPITFTHTHTRTHKRKHERPREGNHKKVCISFLFILPLFLLHTAWSFPPFFLVPNHDD